jgi:hypothetical protein
MGMRSCVQSGSSRPTIQGGSWLPNDTGENAVEQQVQPVQQQALPTDIEAILQPQPSPDPLATPAVDPSSLPAPVQQPPAAPAPHMVPLPEMLEQRHRAQLAEERTKWLESQLEDFRRSQEVQQRAAQPQPEPIDPVNDPIGFANAVAQENARLRGELRSISSNMPANVTEYLVREKYGDEAVDQAVKAAKDAGLGNHFMQQRNPYKALMEWRNTQTIAQQVGPDLKAWETKKEQEIEARVLARLRAGQAPQPGAPQVLPPPLSTATRADGSAPVVADSADFFRDMLKKR